MFRRPVFLCVQSVNPGAWAYFCGYKMLAVGFFADGTMLSMDSLAPYRVQRARIIYQNFFTLLVKYATMDKRSDRLNSAEMDHK